MMIDPPIPRKRKFLLATNDDDDDDAAKKKKKEEDDVPHHPPPSSNNHDDDYDDKYNNNNNNNDTSNNNISSKTSVVDDVDTMTIILPPTIIDNNNNNTAAIVVGDDVANDVDLSHHHQPQQQQHPPNDNVDNAMMRMTTMMTNPATEERVMEQHTNNTDNNDEQTKNDNKAKLMMSTTTTTATATTTTATRQDEVVVIIKGGCNSSETISVLDAATTTTTTSSSSSFSSPKTNNNPMTSHHHHHKKNNHPPPPPPPIPAAYPTLRRAIVTNDGTDINLIRLIGLKSLFAKQLPKMPKEYIARLLFDRKHVSLALLSSSSSESSSSTTSTKQKQNNNDTDEDIIGGICYRPYPDMKFGEIAFCAISASQQVKGYGSKLMNLAKMHALEQYGIEYLITYADNYAIGYFKKQGFTKSVQMHKSRYQGLIKDYDGGTIMECYIHPSIDYTRIPEMIAAQKQFVHERIRLLSKSDKESTGFYPSLPPNFAQQVMERNGSNAREGTNRAIIERALCIPGVIEAGWTASDMLSLLCRNTSTMSTTTTNTTTTNTTGGSSSKDSDRRKTQLKNDLLAIVSKVSEQQFAWCFRDPVNTNEVIDYLEVIKDPIDLRTMEKRIRKGDWYKNMNMLYLDLMKMANNCKVYNGEGSPYYEHAVSLERYLGTIFPRGVVSMTNTYTGSSAVSSSSLSMTEEGAIGSGGGGH